MDKINLSVILPAYNEEKNLKNGILDEVYRYVKDNDNFLEVVIVDDGSTDNTVKLVKEYIKNKSIFRLIANKHGGKAITVMTGMIQSKGNVALFSDMDQATPLREIEKFLPKLRGGFDIVIGSRSGRKGAPILRKVAAWGFSVLRNIILGLPFNDTQCGFKAFNRKSIEAVFPSLLAEWKMTNKLKGAAVNAGFDAETLFLAKKKNFKIAEISVEWHYVGTQRVQLIKDSLDAIKDMLRIRLNDLSGKYG